MRHATLAAERLQERLTNEERISLMRAWLQDHPHRPAPYEVIVSPYGVPVYALVGYLEATEGNLCTVAEDYEVPLDAVKAALAYYIRYPEIITARIEANSGVSYLGSLGEPELFM